MSDRWDRFVAAHPDGDLLQTSAWARVKSSSMHDRVVTVERDGRVVGGGRMNVRRFGPIAGFGYVPYGPLFAPGLPAGVLDDVRCEVVAGLEAAAREMGAHALLMQPGRSDTVLPQALESLGYRTARMDVAPTASVVVDLTASVDDLRAGLNRSRRKNLKKSHKAGVKVRRGDHTDLAMFFELHTMSAERNGFVPMSFDYIERQWSILAPEGHLFMLIAEHEGVPDAAGLFTAYGPRVDFKLTGWRSDRESSRRCPNDALQWEALLVAKEMGHTAFDMGGLPRSHAEAILAAGGEIPAEIEGSGTEFKLAYGGAAELYPSTLERVLTPIGHLTHGLPSRLLREDGLGGRLVNLIRRT